jgi:hypothetical protein
MSKFAIPLGALILGGFGLMLAAVGALNLAVSDTSPPDLNVDLPKTVETEPIKLLVYHDERRAYGGAQIVLQRSPFVEDRSAFRVELAQPTSAQMARINTAPPRFLGTLGSRESRRALIVFVPNEAAASYGVGDKTSGGTVISIGETELVLEQSGQRKMIRLFDALK